MICSTWRYSERGFTLTELMVVVAVVAFVSAAVIPSFGITLRRGRQREAGHLIVQGVYAARAMAARTGRPHWVRVQLDNARVNGGHGGAVTVDRCQNAARCSQTVGAVCNPVSVKCASCTGDQGDPVHAIDGQVRAGLVGRDVALSAAVDRDAAGQIIAQLAPGGQAQICFEPTGGMFNPRTVVFTVQAFDALGQTEIIPRFVTLRAGGSVRYGNDPFASTGGGGP